MFQLVLAVVLSHEAFLGLHRRRDRQSLDVRGYHPLGAALKRKHLQSRSFAGGDANYAYVERGDKLTATHVLLPIDLPGQYQLWYVVGCLSEETAEREELPDWLGVAGVFPLDQLPQERLQSLPPGLQVLLGHEKAKEF